MRVLTRSMAGFVAGTFLRLAVPAADVRRTRIEREDELGGVFGGNPATGYYGIGISKGLSQT